MEQVRSERKLKDNRADSDLTSSLEKLYVRWKEEHIRGAAEGDQPLSNKQARHAGFIHNITTGARRSVELWDLTGLEYYHTHGRE
jgi:hypothetical protein